MRILQRSNKILSHVIIFVPGFKGTELVEVSTNRSVWINLVEAVFNRHTLVLPTEDNFTYRNETIYRPGDVLKEISVIPGVYNYDAYGSVFKFLESVSDESMEVWQMPYDWRQDLADSATILDGLVEQAQSSGAKHITLVGHSMGGLIVSYYLRYGGQSIETAKENWHGASQVSSVILAGVPFRGALSVLHDIQYGIVSGLNRSLISPEAMSSFCSTYFLFPHPKQDLAIDFNGENVHCDIFSPEFYVSRRWGPLRGISDPELRSARQSFLMDKLHRASLFFNLLHKESVVEPPDIRGLNIVGTGRETLTRALVDKKGALLFLKKLVPYADREIILPKMYASGDSIVTYESAKLPKSYERLGVSEIQNCSTHGALFSDSRTQIEICTLLDRTSHSHGSKCGDEDIILSEYRRN